MMRYTPNLQTLLYGELNFVSKGSQDAVAIIAYDLDALFDEVSEQVFALFVGPLPPSRYSSNTAVMRQAQQAQFA